MAGIEDILKQKVDRINKDKVRRAKISAWLGKSHDGKIFCVRLPRKSYHIVLTKTGVSLRDGDYPSCEAAYWGDEDAVAAVFNGQSNLYSGVKAGKLKVYGSLNEATKFEALL